MGALNAYVFNSTFNPIIPPMMQVPQRSQQSGMTYSQMATAAQKSEDDLTINGINLIDDVKGLAGQKMVQHSLMLNYQSEMNKIKSEASKKLFDAKNDNERSQILSTLASDMSSLKARSLMPIQMADTYKNDLDLYNQDVKDLNKYGSTSPAMRLSIGAYMTDDHPTSDGYTVRTRNFAQLAGSGLVYTDEKGNILSKGQHLHIANNDMSVDRYGRPMVYAENRYVTPAEDKDYMASIKANMKVSGNQSGNKIKAVLADNEVVIDQDSLDKIMVNGAGAKISEFSSNNSALNIAAEGMFKKLDAHQIDYVGERLMMSGATTNAIGLSNGKKMDPMLYSDIPQKIFKLRQEYDAMPIDKRDTSKASLMEEQMMKLSRAFIIGMKQQVIADAFGWKKENLQVSNKTSYIRTSQEYKTEMAINKIEKNLDQSYIKGLNRENPSNNTAPFTFFVPADDGRKVAMNKGVAYAQLPSSVNTDMYMDYLYKTRVDSPTPETKTIGNLATKYVLFGGDVVNTSTKGLMDASNMRTTGEVMVGPRIVNGKPDLSSMDQTYVMAEYDINDDSQKALMLNRISNHNKLNTFIDGVQVSSVNASVMEDERKSFHDFTKFSMPRMSSPIDDQVFVGDGKTKRIKVWVPVDMDAIRNVQATRANTQEMKNAIDAAQQAGMNNDDRALGTTIQRMTEKIDIPDERPVNQYDPQNREMILGRNSFLYK